MKPSKVTAYSGNNYIVPVTSPVKAIMDSFKTYTSATFETTIDTHMPVDSVAMLSIFQPIDPAHSSSRTQTSLLQAPHSINISSSPQLRHTQEQSPDAPSKRMWIMVANLTQMQTGSFLVRK
jgi:hypothetical protein